MIWNLWFSLLLLTGTAFAAVENIDTFNDGTTPVVNENFRTLNDNVNKANTNVQTLTAYFTGGILGAAYGGTGQDSSNWTSGDYVYMSSTGVWGHTSLSHGNQLFTSSGTFTAPVGVTKIYVSMCGGGGGGAGGRGGGAGTIAGGGSAANCLLLFPYTVVPGNNYTVTIGAAGSGGTGGTSGAGTNGTDGGDTSFDTLTTLGGKKGTTTTAGTNTSITRNAGATDGVAGNNQELGGNGGLGAFNVNGGGGGASIFGKGGLGQSGNGGSPTGYGAGGASGIDWNLNPGGNGSAGTQGFVLVIY